jgi:hypothetical protein
MHSSSDWLVPAENAALLGRTSDLRECTSISH